MLIIVDDTVYDVEVGGDGIVDEVVLRLAATAMPAAMATAMEMAWTLAMRGGGERVVYMH